VDWIQLAQCKVQWWSFVSMITYEIQLMKCEALRKTLHHGDSLLVG
jgi:hypothetical protein